MELKGMIRSPSRPCGSGPTTMPMADMHKGATGAQDMKGTMMMGMEEMQKMPMSGNNDEDFASNIQNNTPRYVSHFEEVADKLLPPTTIDASGGDIIDYFQVRATICPNMQHYVSTNC